MLLERKEKKRIKAELKPASFYDADYYEGKTSNWDRPYTWPKFKSVFIDWFKFLLHAFPETRSFLDVGCGRGFLERCFHDYQHAVVTLPEIYGFDHSVYAIENAEEEAKPNIECASIDDFVFRKNFDVMLALDVFEHVAEEQARNFLLRSRKHVNDCIFAVIALDYPHHWDDQSHVNLQTRAYWHRIFLECGWEQGFEQRWIQELAMQYDCIKLWKCEVFVYSPVKERNGE